jgi:uncharacterized MAPEG superfamily protein
MTIDLWMLVLTAVLAGTIPLLYGIGRFGVPGGAIWAFGNRETALEGVAPWVARAVRAHQNLTENIAPFAILVLVADIANKSSAETALGSMMFFWGRVAHLLTYTAGMIYVRTLVFGVAVAGEILILVQICK